MFDNKQIIAAAQRHAALCYPKESCGLVVNNKYIPRRNCHPTPERNFKISAQGYLWATRRGDVQAVVHSHPDGPPHPSKLDMERQIATGLPWLIIPTNSNPFWLGAPVQDYLGREFRHGTADCYTLIRDWYNREMGYDLPEYPRDDKWWDNGENLYLDNFAAAGFRQLPADEPLQRGDGLLAAIRSNGVVNHGAIYLGNNQILHHLYNRLSCIDLYSSWQKYFTIRVRHK